jgi:cation diffusion facilitator family transporter
MRLESGVHELPPDRERDLARAVLLAWITIGFLVSAIVLVYLTLGSSQAMRAAWIEDLVTVVSPIAFLVATRIRKRGPDARHPYGYHRAVAIGYLVSSVALLTIGAYVLYESAVALLRAEHPTIGSVTLLGHTIWLGWLMIGALAYTIVPAVLLGRLKLPLAHRLHDKALYADAKMLKADWGTAAAGIVGIIGIGVGLWWADSVAAIAIAADITHDGWRNTSTAMADLADARPRVVDGSAIDPLQARLQTALEDMEWVTDAYVRLRDEGHVFYGEALVVPERTVAPGEIERAVDALKALDWRLHEIVISPVESIDGRPADH